MASYFQVPCICCVLVLDLREAFALFDKDNDGTITASELCTVMQSLGQPVTEKESKEMIKQVCRDGGYHYVFCRTIT